MLAAKDELFTRPSGGYTIARSVRLRSSASAYFNRTLTTPTSGTKWTWSGWVKRGILTAGTGTAQILISAGSATAFFRFSTTDTLISGWTGASNLETTQVFRDPSAWYHIMLVVDTTQATASNRVKYYVNGIQITAFSTTDYPTQNSTTTINSAVAHNIGAYTSSSQYFDGYLTEINFIDGQALTPSSFGSTNAITGVWQPAKYTGTYGNNGFYLNFSDNSSNTATTIGKDYSGNGNNWTPNNISVTAGVTYDSMTDVPTLTSATAANYCVLNPLDSRNITVSNGNLTVTYATASWSGGRSSFVVPKTGSWKWEVTPTTMSYGFMSIATSSATLTGQGYDGANVFSFYLDSGEVRYGSANQTTVSISSVNDVHEWRVNNGAVTLYRNNTLLWTYTQTLNDITGDYFPATWIQSGAVHQYNFGQRPWTYSPTGFVALNTYNLPTSTITNGAKYMAASTYTGNLTGQSITNGGNNTLGTTFQPDLVWIKSRSAATDNKWTDSVRGATKALVSNSQAAETTDTTGLTALNSNGFTVGANTDYNNTSATYVAWQWQAGASAGSSNTNGSITSTVSAGATQGFSVVTYTGTGANATVGHGIGVAPQMVIVKQRNGGSTYWTVYQTSLASGYAIYLNATFAAGSDPSTFNSTAPTSSVFSIGTSTATNTNGNTYVAYCFAAVKGFSAFGSYTGNGSTDGPFTYLGFRPRWLMIKRSSTASVTYAWQIYDTSRQPYNTASSDPNLWADTSAAEGTGNYTFDLLSNGFKLRSSGVNENASGDTYIYAAFAENPFKNALAR